MDKNGYNPSLFDTEDGICYLTKRRVNTARHEIFNASNRQQSKKDGLWVCLAPDIHELVHKNHLGVWDSLKQEAELLWIKNHGTQAEFVARYGRNYL